MTRKILSLALVLFCAVGATGVRAGTVDKLRHIEEQLSEKKQQQEKLATTSRAASKGLDELRVRLIRSAQALQEKAVEKDALEDRLDALTTEIAEKSKKAAEERRRLSLMVSALVEIASRPPDSLFLQNRVTEDHIHRSLLLKAILPRLKDDAENEARDLAVLYDLQAQLARQKKLVASAHENLQKQQRDLDRMIAARQGFLQQTEAQKAEVARHLADLASQAQNLRQLMEKVAPQRPHGATPPRNLGTLRWPVSGVIERHFGDKDADGVTSEGLTLAAPSGAPVVAPYAGRVVFAGPFRGYGLIVILQHGRFYHSFLSGFGRIDAEMGQGVEAGEPLGVLPVKGGAKPEIYFEWRRGDQPVDPMHALESGHL